MTTKTLKFFDETWAQVLVAVTGNSTSGPFALNVSLERTTPAAVLSLAYTDAVDPTAFLDVRDYAGFEIGPIPVEANGLTMTPLSADDAAGTGKAIPYFYDGVTKTAMPGIAVATGDRIEMKAEVFPVWFLGLRFSVAFTGTIPVRPKG